MTKTLPRFEQTMSGHLVGDTFVRPLVPSVARLLDGTPQASAHDKLARRWSELRTTINAATDTLDAARRADTEAGRKAIAAGKPTPKPKAPTVEDEIARAREELALVQTMLRESAHELLVASVPHLAEADAAAQAATEQTLDAVHEALAAVRDRLNEAAERAAESGWLTGLRQTGVVGPWRGGRTAQPLPRVTQLVGQALGVLPDERDNRATRREQDEREQERAKENLPPGATIWRDGQTFRVGDDGTPQPVAEVER